MLLGRHHFFKLQKSYWLFSGSSLCSWPGASFSLAQEINLLPAGMEMPCFLLHWPVLGGWGLFCHHLLHFTHSAKNPPGHAAFSSPYHTLAHVLLHVTAARLCPVLLLGSAWLRHGTALPLLLGTACLWRPAEACLSYSLNCWLHHYDRLLHSAAIQN